ncbi:hypothetical protein EHE19_009000 [Ruminiclostridium herbifermentans]|uniref:Serine/threonine protein kinase n=1 Tax=Ruminiclostridium herbifermentans TaxID=2488810 RepID=A0A4V6EQ17_9FIRM|nr:hypothetical protein [Ruminiclostridium herbifermentans]QNU68516.1 hypothetical protein EHE19_009000 [Ruminiclostridium herbifermentans]
MGYDYNKIILNIKNGKHSRLGIGSSRIVYDLNDGFVVKIAKDIRGIFQNEAEHKTYLSHKSVLFAEVIDISEDNRFLIMPKAERIKNINTVLRYYRVKSIKSLFYKDKLIISDIHENNLSRNDLYRVSSWGLINNVPLIIDYGLTHNIFKKFYGYNRFFKKYKPIHYF